jgi:flagellar capping protein FliD
MSQDTNTITLDIKSLTSEIDIMHKMLSEKDILIVNMNQKFLNMEEQMKQLVEQNKNMETQLSRLMSYLVSFAVDVRYDLRHLKYK